MNGITEINHKAPVTAVAERVVHTSAGNRKRDGLFSENT